MNALIIVDVLRLVYLHCIYYYYIIIVLVVELVDTYDLGSYAEMRESSSLSKNTILSS